MCRNIQGREEERERERKKEKMNEQERSQCLHLAFEADRMGRALGGW